MQPTTLSAIRTGYSKRSQARAFHIGFDMASTAAALSQHGDFAKRAKLSSMTDRINAMRVVPNRCHNAIPEPAMPITIARGQTHERLQRVPCWCKPCARAVQGSQKARSGFREDDKIQISGNTRGSFISEAVWTAAPAASSRIIASTRRRPRPRLYRVTSAG